MAAGGQIGGGGEVGPVTGLCCCSAETAARWAAPASSSTPPTKHPADASGSPNYTGDQIRLGQGIAWADKQPGDHVRYGTISEFAGEVTTVRRLG